jgi:hypothetical protein
MQQIKNIIVFSKKALGKEKVQLKVWETQAGPDMKDRITEKTWQAVKSGDGWKLIIPMSGRSSSEDLVTRKGPDGKEVKVQIEHPGKDEQDPRRVEYLKKALPNYLGMLKKHIQEIEAGKYETRKQAQDALRMAEEAFRKENPPPKIDREEKPKADKAEPKKDQ